MPVRESTYLVFLLSWRKLPRLESCTEVQDFGEGHSFSAQGLIADSGNHQGSAAGLGVNPLNWPRRRGLLWGKPALGGGCSLLFS